MHDRHQNGRSALQLRRVFNSSGIIKAGLYAPLDGQGPSGWRFRDNCAQLCLHPVITACWTACSPLLRRTMRSHVISSFPFLIRPTCSPCGKKRKVCGHTQPKLPAGVTQGGNLRLHRGLRRSKVHTSPQSQASIGYTFLPFLSRGNFSGIFHKFCSIVRFPRRFLHKSVRFPRSDGCRKAGSGHTSTVLRF